MAALVPHPSKRPPKGSDTSRSFARPIPLDFSGRHTPPALKTSHTIVGLAVAVVAFLGAMQVIGTQAQGDEALMREMYQKVLVAEASSGVSIVPVAAQISSGILSAQTSALESRAGLFQAPAPEPAEASSPTEAAQATEPETIPMPESSTTGDTEPTTESPASDLCPPDSGGAPYCTYFVQEGDTLSDIAVTLGIDSTPAFSGAELIALSNGLNDAENWLIQIGQELRVPLGSGVIHSVGESETISVLAELYGISLADIIAANNLADVHSVVVGATLLIPSPNLWPLSSPGSVALSEQDEEEASAEATEESTVETEEAESEPTEEETPTETPAPEVTRAAPSAHANPSVAEIRDQFAAGYIAAGGPAQHLERILASVIPCESGYNLRAYNPAGPFYGLMQFLPETWARTGGGDWFDAWQQGHNTAVLLQRSTPQSQWPSCWR